MPEKANKPPKLISLTSDKPSSQDAGMPITWTAKAKDPDNDQIFYKFLLNDNHVTNWTKNNTWVWNTTNDDVGENQIEVQVRDGKYGHALPNEFDGSKNVSFTITEPKPKPAIPENQPPFIVSLVSDKFSPQDAGTIITWTAKASDPENDRSSTDSCSGAGPFPIGVRIIVGHGPPLLTILVKTKSKFK